MKKIKLLFIAIVVIAVSCIDPSGNHVIYSSSPAYITAKSIPAAGKVGETLNIIATAEAYSDCWSNLMLNFKESETLEYHLYATGNYESYGTCNATIITRDSIIEFKPLTAGKYVVKTMRSPQWIETDTIFVSE